LEALKSICEGDLQKLELCLKKSWNPNETIDNDEKYSAVTLACHLDKLEALHLLDLYGADLNVGAGKFN
jgi:hypothetical protein